MKQLILKITVFGIMALQPLLGEASELMAGLNIYDFDYKEMLEPPLKSTEKATVFAPMIGFQTPLAGGPSFFRITGEISGSTKSRFDGSTQSGTPVTDTDYLSFFKTEGNFYFAATPNFYFYTGLGYFYWDRFLSGGAGYREIYTWYTMPVGFLLEVPVTPSIQWGLDLSYRMMSNGKIKVIFSETIINGQDTTLTLGNKAGYKIQMPVRIQLASPQYSLVIAPWYESSEIGESNFEYNATMNGFIMEPASRTYQFGVATGLTSTF